MQISQEVGQEDDQAQSNADEPYIIEEEVAEGKFVCDVSLETMETEYVNSEELGSTPEGICTPEESWNPGHIDMGNPPMIWCGVNEAELDQNQATCDNQDFAPMVPQIEGWIPVVLPVEQAPPGAFDGIWKNEQEEIIEINHSQIMFQSGESWIPQVLSPTSISVQVSGLEFNAEFDPDALTLSWNDGDIWNRIDQTDNQKQWATVSPQSADGSCLLWEAAQVTGEQFFVDSTPTTKEIPEDAQEWEVCWDWAKKGWCPRANCEWYHPGRPSFSDQCQPCGPTFDDGPFADEQQQTSFNPSLPVF